MLSEFLHNAGDPQWLASVFGVFLFIWALYRHFTHPLSKVPATHWSASWSSAHILWTKYFSSVRCAHYNAHLNKGGDFRPVIRVGPNEVSLMTTEGVEIVFTGGFDRAPWYDVFSNFGVKNMFSVSSRDAHSRRRRLLGSAYSKTSVNRPRVQNIIKSRIGKFMSFIEHQLSLESTSLGKSGPIVVRNIFRPLEADIYTAFAFSENQGTDFLANLRPGANTVDDTGMSEIDLFHDEKRDPFWFWESEMPTLFRHIMPFFSQSGQRIHKRAEKWIMDLMQHYEEGVGNKTAPESTYGKMFAWKDVETGKQLSFKERASEIMDDCLAGHDSVPAALEYMVRQLCEHPDVQSRLHVELLTFLPLASEERTMAMLDNLPYLNAVIMEGLRLVDTILSYETRTVPPGGCMIEGFYMPPGTTVATQPHLINRLPTVFSNPEVFDPSRWLLPREEYLALAKHMWIFSSGPRGCIAKEFALSIMKTVIVDIYIKYTTRLVNELRTERRSWEGRDSFAEVQFEHTLACEEGERLVQRGCGEFVLDVDEKVEEAKEDAGVGWRPLTNENNAKFGRPLLRDSWTRDTAPGRVQLS